MNNKSMLMALIMSSGLGFAKESPVLLDVRTQEEWNEKHLEGSTLIDFKKPDFKENLSKLDKNKSYDVYCRSGNRSVSAVKVMKQLGFKHVRSTNTVEETQKISSSKCIGEACLK